MIGKLYDLLVGPSCDRNRGSFTSLVLPQYEAIVSRWMSPLQDSELAFVLWLLIMVSLLETLFVRVGDVAVLSISRDY